MAAGSRVAIDDPIVCDTWSYLGNDGKRHMLDIVVGRPVEIPGHSPPEWACPLFIEGMTLGVKQVRGGWRCRRPVECDNHHQDDPRRLVGCGACRG
jgi:hypothetical protein